MTSASGYAVAPLGRRAAAWIFDTGIGVLLGAGLVMAAGGTGDLKVIAHLLTFKSVGGRTGRALAAAANPVSPQLSALKPIAGIVVLLTVITLATIAYRVSTTAKWGAGVGKALLGLRVVVDDPDRHRLDPPGWARSWRRWAVPQVPGLIPLPATGLLAYLPALRDERRRGLHDRAAGTIVVDVRAPRRPIDRPAHEAAPPRDEYFVSIGTAR